MIDLTTNQRLALINAVGGQFEIVENNRIGPGLARKGLAFRDEHYERKVWGCDLSGPGYVNITYWLTPEGKALREELLKEDV